jgi:Cof subfamily protein (haloacid dehalogenase superfamily)
MYRLVAVDLDDTLLNGEGLVSEGNRAALHRAERAGVRVVIVSGRSYASTKQFIKALELPSLTVSLNGACIQDPADDRTVAEFPIDPALTRRFLQDVEPFQVHVNYYNREAVYSQSLTEAARMYNKMNRIEIEIVDSLAELSQEKPAAKLLLHADPERLSAARALLETRYGSLLNIVTSKPFFLEATDKAASKGAALLAVAAAYGVSPRETVAIGDSENDLSMLRAAGLGVAMANATDRVKAVASAVTLSNSEDGVAHAIDSFVLPLL